MQLKLRKETIKYFLRQRERGNIPFRLVLRDKCFNLPPKSPKISCNETLNHRTKVQN